MGKSVLISIRPEWCELIANGKKTIEVRKTKPNCILPLKVYIYETKALCSTPQFIDEDGHVDYRGKGQVIGEFTCHNITPLFEGSDLRWWRDIEKGEYGEKIERKTCLTTEQMLEYAGGENKDLWMWKISDLKIYDVPKELSEFKPFNRTECFYSDLGLAIPKCEDCHKCKVTRPPQSWMYVE